MAMAKTARPHRRTHTWTFTGCTCLKSILSPKHKKGLKTLVSRLEGIVRAAGFSITEDPDTKVPDVVARPFGEGYGYTIVMVLSESHVAIHTYPEEKFGQTVEVEFNLCYLTTDHQEKLDRAFEGFCAFFTPKKALREESGKRFL